MTVLLYYTRVSSQVLPELLLLLLLSWSAACVCARNSFHNIITLLLFLLLWQCAAAAGRLGLRPPYVYYIFYYIIVHNNNNIILVRATLYYYNKGRRHDVNEPWADRLIICQPHYNISCASCIHIIRPTDMYILNTCATTTTTADDDEVYSYFFHYYLFFSYSRVCETRSLIRSSSQRRVRRIYLLPPQPYTHTHTPAIIRYWPATGAHAINNPVGGGGTRGGKTVCVAPPRQNGTLKSVFTRCANAAAAAAPHQRAVVRPK